MKGLAFGTVHCRSGVISGQRAGQGHIFGQSTQTLHEAAYLMLFSVCCMKAAYAVQVTLGREQENSQETRFSDSVAC